jgi:hypothetical protein
VAAGRREEEEEKAPMGQIEEEELKRPATPYQEPPLEWQGEKILKFPPLLPVVLLPLPQPYPVGPALWRLVLWASGFLVLYSIKLPPTNEETVYPWQPLLLHFQFAA